MTKLTVVKNKPEMDFDKCLIHCKNDDGELSGEILIDARLLHKYLCVRKRYDDWFDDILKFSDFERSDDYFGVVDHYGEYVLSLKMAREVALLARSETGLEAIDHINSLLYQEEKRVRAERFLEKFRLIANPKARKNFFEINDFEAIKGFNPSSFVTSQLSKGSFTEEEAREQRILNELIFNKEVMDKLQGGSH